MSNPQCDHERSAPAKKLQTLDATLAQVTAEQMSPVELYFDLHHYARKLRKLNGPLVENFPDPDQSPDQLRRALALIKYRIQGLKFLAGATVSTAAPPS